MALTAEVLVCTRCTLWPREVPEAPNGWTPSGLATVRVDDGVFTVTPHKDGCTQLGQVIRDRT